ncbi:metal-dependent hydrolase [Paenibacillus sp. IB182496]|uniref:Metal-dependent hydrolase n=1 Tax=Paenibacillus sabuli TaxID=2772509 RepID=A0A927BUC5_9BACL|nr:metal-dependent hydrolase [Paenibacillus sabuli]MBD2845674.1 metal-dependent hydrolase [Paenibacillus sabuli]
MDTGSHLMVGLGLGAWAGSEALAAGHPGIAAGLIAGSVLGAQAPDLDCLARLRSKAAYLRQHRSASHALTAAPLWSLGIALALQALWGGTLPLPALAGWTFIAVLSHLLLDLCNDDGVRLLYPRRKRYAFSILPGFDPLLFGGHAAALLAWTLLGTPADVLLPLLYIAIGVYLIWRLAERRRLSQRLPGLDPGGGQVLRYVVLPTPSLRRWHVVKCRPDGGYLIGEWTGEILVWTDELNCSDEPSAQAAAQHPEVKAFLSFTTLHCARVTPLSWGYEVCWIDVRYRRDRQYPLAARVLLDSALQPVGCYVGWHSRRRRARQVQMCTY